MSGVIGSVSQEGIEALEVRLEKFADVRARLRVAVRDETTALEQRVRTKLSGEVLQVRTGKLRESTWSRIGESGAVVSGTVGNSAVYARRHELGFVGTEQVKEHLRTITQAFGKALKSPVITYVRAHSRKVDYPAHSFLRSSLDENRERIKAALTAAVMEPS